jgi:hypothetical protein
MNLTNIGLFSFLLILMISLNFVDAIINEVEPKCHDLPHSDFLTAQELDRACMHRKMWLHDRDANGPVNFEDKVTGNFRLFYTSIIGPIFSESDGLHKKSGAGFRER